MAVVTFTLKEMEMEMKGSIGNLIFYKRGETNCCRGNNKNPDDP